MPEIRSVPVKASSLKVGDELLDGRIVVSVDVKQKWTTVYFETAPQLDTRHKRVENDTEFLVKRSFKTAEENAADQLAFKLRQLDGNEQSVKKHLTEVHERITAQMASVDEVSSSTLGDLLAAQAAKKTWGRITHVAKIQADRAVAFDAETGTWHVRDDAEVAAEHDGSPAMDRLTCVEYIKEKVTQELIEFISYTSRSSSVISNAAEDYDRQAKANFVRDMRWLSF